MELRINFERLDEILRAFFSITGIKIIIFDEKRNIISAYPRHDCSFCTKIKSFPATAEKCLLNDVGIFNECKKKGKLILYTCHAGLVEGCAPIIAAGTVVGYIMFGQISDLPSREVLLQNIEDVCRSNSLSVSEFTKVAKSIKLKSYDTIMASAKIFEACVSYIVLNEMLLPKQDKTMLECERYISENLATVSVDVLCEHLDMSRTALYELFKLKTGQGVSHYIRGKQLEEAKTLLTQTDMTVSAVSEMCGFSDYNYFSRVFKKTYGYSASSVRKNKI